MLYPMEQKLMAILWGNAPLTAAHLARLAAEEIGWKRTTTYTVIARLAERGIVERNGRLVRPLLTRKEAEEAAIRDLLDGIFEGDGKRLTDAVARVLPPIPSDDQKAVDNLQNP